MQVARRPFAGGRAGVTALRSVASRRALCCRAGGMREPGSLLSEREEIKTQNSSGGRRHKDDNGKEHLLRRGGGGGIWGGGGAASTGRAQPGPL